MFRALLAAAFVSVAFGATLYFSGDYLQAWETPEPARAQAAPAHRKKAKRKRSATVKPTRKANAKPAWLAQLNTLCRRGQAELAAIPTPLTPEGTTDYLRQVTRVNRRWNRQATVLLERGAGRDRKAVRQLLRLLRGEEPLISRVVSALEKRQFERLDRLMPQVVAVGKSENRLLAKLGARDCTLAEDAFRSKPLGRGHE